MSQQPPTAPFGDEEKRQYGFQPHQQPQNFSQPQTLNDATQPYINPQQWQYNNQQTVNIGYATQQFPYQEPQLSWYKDMRRNRPQSLALLSPYFVFMSGGMSLCWSIGFKAYPNKHGMVDWFIAVMIGACISAGLVNIFRKRLFYLVSSALVILNGVLYIAVGTNFTAIAVARYCDGIAFGLALIPAILAGSEQSVKRFRGQYLSIEQLGLSCGFLIALVTTRIQSEFSDLRFHIFYGVMALVFGSIALICAIFNTIESPIFLLRKDNESEAIDNLRRLQTPKEVTAETHVLLNEHKALLFEDQNRGTSENISLSLIPLLKMIIFRCFIALFSSLPISSVFLIAIIIETVTAGGYSTGNYLYWYGFMRVIGGLIGLYTIDTVGRRITNAIAIVGGGIILVIIGLQNLDKFTFLTNSTLALILLLFYHMISGIVAPASTCYLGEAFPISTKPYCILAVVLVENILQIIIILAVNTINVTTFCYTFGAMQIVYGILFVFLMPETRQRTLRNALKSFQILVSFNISIHQ